MNNLIKEKTMEKINIAELLKDCPIGMELDCVMYDKVILVGVDNDLLFPIKVRRKDGYLFTLTKYGQYCDSDYAKCVIFPKGKTTWEGFHRPFKDGDIVFTTLGNIAIIRKPIEGELFYVYGIMAGNYFYKDETTKVVVEHLATEEEKQKLFDAIKANGYKWNTETKTLEKLIKPKFKVGDRVKHKSAYTSGIVVKVDDKGYHIDYPKGEGVCYIAFTLEKDYILAPNKFDITDLVPFESKVLVRDYDIQIWVPTFWGKYLKDDSNCSYITTSGCYKYCIPYERNEHLLGTNNDCDEHFKIWK